MAQKEVAVTKGPAKEATPAKPSNVKLEEGEVEEKPAKSPTIANGNTVKTEKTELDQVAPAAASTIKDEEKP